MRRGCAAVGLGIAAVVAIAAIIRASHEGPPARRVRMNLKVDGAGVAELVLGAAERVRIETAGGSFYEPLWLHLWDETARAEVAVGSPPRLGWNTALEYRNPHREPRKYTLVYEGWHARQIDLVRDGRSWLQDVPIARRLAVPPGAGHQLQLASVPGGGREFRLYGLDCEGRLRAVVRDGGPTGLPRIAGLDRLCSVIVRAPLGAASVSVYANDSEDRDGDGLGRVLERALKTCDGVECGSGVLASYYRGEAATRDSDRDGVPDAAEVFGLGPLLDFPRYGASPRHKDVFVEIDHDRRVRGIGMSEADLAEVAAMYAAGSAADVKNPDGKPGIALHFDTGFEPADPTRSSLLGDWGGSGRASEPNYRTARARDFTAERAGYFRYAFMTKTGRGQARGDAFTVNRELQRVSIFAHELGHTLGLAHHGHDDWGRSNCKPHYFSLMNYVYQNRQGVGFSREEGAVLDPAAVLETVTGGEGLPPADVLRDVPLELDVFDRGVDWNRDGVISTEPVRAALGWATYKSCGSAGFARTTLAAQPVAPLRAATPGLVRLRDRLYALFVTEDGALHARHGALSGPDASGSCPEGDAEGTKCTAWSMPSLVHGVEPMVDMRVLAWTHEEAVLGYVRADGQVRIAVLAPQGEVLDVRRDRDVIGAWSDRAPALARAAVAGWRYGAEELLRVVYRAADGRLQQASAVGPEGEFRMDDVVDADERPIVAGVAPSVITLGTGELCGVFPDVEAYVRWYCYEREADHWVDLTRTAFFAGYGPKTAGPVGLAFHRARLADGRLAVDDGTRGSVVMSFTEPESTYAKNPDNPHYFVSEWIDGSQPARTHGHFRWRGSVIDEWTNVAPGTGLSLYEDDTMSALKGLMLAKSGEPEVLKLDFLPFADGVHEERMGAGNDFRVMESGVCEGLKGKGKC